MNARVLGVNVSADEYDWVKHAADLSHLSLQQFVKIAINEKLTRQGVDAVLLKLKTDPRRRRPFGTDER